MGVSREGWLGIIRLFWGVFFSYRFIFEKVCFWRIFMIRESGFFIRFIFKEYLFYILGRVIF